MGIRSRVFALLFGALLGLSLLKFGNPIVMERFVEHPSNIYEWIFNPWPLYLGYGLLGIVAVAGLFAVCWRANLPWLIWLPLVWLGWETLAAMQSVDARMSWPTVLHFATCVACFYLGLFALGRSRHLGLFSLGLIAGFLLVMAAGWQQHFGGLKSSRDYFFTYIYPQLKQPPPPDLLKKLSTDRIFATLFYPNTLAGVILLLLPMILAVLWTQREKFTVGARGFLMGVVMVAALGCLFWSGSKGGWLLLLAMGFVAVLFQQFNPRLKAMLIATVLLLGLAGFFVKYAGFFKKGAPSVVARFDYWQAALRTAMEKPLFGTGPGTFMNAYARIKRPESEMTRMVHNDFLEQASDSGVVGFLAFAGFVVSALVFTGRKAGLRRDWVKLGVWLGLLGWAMQSFVEFGLYIPAVAWPAFGLLGWLVAQSSNHSTVRPVPAKVPVPE